ncbi:MAG: cytochrome c oxidase subunit II [Candidatus Hodarchaeales archaeon]|jgi:heme/copper-type cytochrome/quinol oxidase subunit 2
MKKVTALYSSSFIAFVSTIISIPTAAQSGFTAGFQNILLLGTFFSIIVGVVVLGLLAYVIIKYRGSSDTIRKRIKNELRLEITIIIFATVIVSILFIASLPISDNIFTEPEYDEIVMITSYLYNFTFTKEDGTITEGYVNLEVNRVYLLNLTSLDVIHSFYSHELSLKIDIIPGRHTTMWLEVLEPGTYEVHCAEYCGPGHHNMMAYIIVS